MTPPASPIVALHAPLTAYRPDRTYPRKFATVTGIESSKSSTVKFPKFVEKRTKVFASQNSIERDNATKTITKKRTPFREKLNNGKVLAGTYKIWFQTDSPAT
jgi:hypothetical protein